MTGRAEIDDNRLRPCVCGRTSAMIFGPSNTWYCGPDCLAEEQRQQERKKRQQFIEGKLQEFRSAFEETSRKVFLTLKHNISYSGLTEEQLAAAVIDVVNKVHQAEAELAKEIRRFHRD